MAKIAFIGKEQILRALTYFGTSVFQVATPQEAEAKLQELVEDQDHPWGIVYIEEPLAEPLLDHIAQLNRRPLPVISIFPSTGEKKGLSGQILNNLVRKVTGVEIRFD
ncbi:MAG: V-type ATP synthase subunit F [Candidatus Vecturithrix sp.]|jgi:vacuolar-type H+-ATPase subunit F/Vma7|nr:V-type ATP synthase subunit F [Candidatus Vecturithrix sp.]